MRVRCPSCIHCGKNAEVEITREQYELLVEGRLHIQNIFPDWGPEARELLITGTHPECWKAMFADSDEVDAAEEDEDE